MNTLSITELVTQIKGNLESNFRSLAVSGEVTNLSVASSGHYYFTLSDANSSLSCALFKFDAMKAPHIRKVKNGDKIQVFGSISVYSKRGTFQLIAKRIAPIGKGDLQAQFEELKLKLQNDGLFDQSLKKEIPAFPKKVALITAKQGAALQDFLNITKNKALSYNLTIIPTLVQGENGAIDIMRSIDKAESLDDLELIIIMRGGGSLEDLWCFNNEELTRKIFDTGIPIISAVGHQTDFTLCDFVSDLRVETPSAAAEVLINKQRDINESLKMSAKALLLSLVQKISQYKSAIEKANPVNLTRIIKSKFDRLQASFKGINFIKSSERALDLNEFHMRLDENEQRMRNFVSRKVEGINSTLDKNLSLLNALGPSRVLKRGYSIVKDQGTVVDSIKSFDKIEQKQKLEITFHDGNGIVVKD